MFLKTNKHLWILFPSPVQSAVCCYEQASICGLPRRCKHDDREFQFIFVLTLRKNVLIDLNSSSALREKCCCCRWPVAGF